MPSEISRLYDQVMAGVPGPKVMVSSTPRTPAPTRQNVAAGIATDLKHCLHKRLPMGIMATDPEVTTEIRGGRVVFTASVEVGGLPMTALETMKEAIDHGQDV